MSPILMILITIASLQSRTTVSSQFDKFRNCSTSFQCRNITGIRYPFWGSSPTSYYGHPDFQLTSSGRTKSISMSGLTYRPLLIDNPTRFLSLARTDYLSGICPLYLHNTTLKTNLSTYNQDALSLTIDNRCSTPSNRALALGLSDQINFTVNSTESSGSYVFSNLTTNFSSALAEPIFEALDSCNDMVVAPANQSDVKGTLSNVILPNEDEPCQRTLTSSSPFSFISFQEKNEDELFRIHRHGFGVVSFGMVWEATTAVTGGTSRFNNDSFDCNCSRAESPLRCNDGRTGLTSGSKSNTRIKIIIGVAGAILVLISCICILKITRNRSVHYHPDAWKSHNQNKEFKMLILNQSHIAQQNTYSEIKKMTKNFACKLGQGGFGGVYRPTMTMSISGLSYHVLKINTMFRVR